ncbi:hypothetical protein CFRA_08350 [Corynebacterium frankenforstense DSM 45800]|uniref:Uncharacterized protein n=1 Tax=Corynebacterium frankenforstense DSM 45800 TaxID=1437875 RepID=A0A1L7CTS8_9CORY|nr:hypothetical protein [Corynebacterium frankenforstense]APT89266.1 hypothetical protein CFRA_08350 [Corynebacterium frankenforstense DSM 45800]
MTPHLRPSVALGVVTASLTAALTGPVTAVASAAEATASPEGILAADGAGHFPVLGLTIGACILVVGLAAVAAFVYIKRRELQAAEKAAAAEPDGYPAEELDGYPAPEDGAYSDAHPDEHPGAHGWAAEGGASRVVPRDPDTTRFDSPDGR